MDFPKRGVILMEGQNNIAILLKGIGFLIIFGCTISGVYYGTNDSFKELGGLQAGVGWGIFFEGIIAAAIFFGFSEIIKLLQIITNQSNKIQLLTPQINDQTSRFVNEVPPIQTSNTSKEKSNQNNIPENIIQLQKPVNEKVQEQIENYYSRQGIIVYYIKGTPIADIYFVKTKSGQEFVELNGGLTPKTLTNDRISNFPILQYYLKG
jgi:hypothetical protein